jgi:hypothetical protein
MLLWVDSRLPAWGGTFAVSLAGRPRQEPVGFRVVLSNDPFSLAVAGVIGRRID